MQVQPSHNHQPVRHGKLVVLSPANAEHCVWWEGKTNRLPVFKDKGPITARMSSIREAEN